MNELSRISSIALRLHPNEDIMTTIVNFAKNHNIEAASISTAVGSVKHCTLRLANNNHLTYFKGPFEIVSLVGTISKGALTHLHISLSDGFKGWMIGGHLP